MQAAKGKRQVTLTLTVEAYQQLQTLAEKGWTGKGSNADNWQN